MTELPACVRLALWVTDAWSSESDASLTHAIERALPDIDHVSGLVEQLRLWRGIGEGALLVALPSPGDPTGLPRCGPTALQEAIDAGEAVFVPGIGGLAIPQDSTFGSEGARGRRLDFTVHEADALPTHRLQALAVPDLERRVTRAMREATEAGDRLGGQPLLGSMAREVADARLGGQWALPAGLPERARSVIVMAGAAASIARTAMEYPDGALDSTTAAARASVVRDLAREADAVLADAANAACAAMAGWVPSR